MFFRKWPNRKQWPLFFSFFTKKEKILFFFFSFVFVASFLYIISSFYIENTILVPKKGGVYIEGVVGYPRFINPAYLESDVDKALVELIFSGLMKYDKDLGIIPDLAESYQVEEDGRVYRVFLRENLFWQNGEPITSEDVVFTIKKIQNPEYKSHFRPNWIGVEVREINEKEIEFRLRRPYSSFIENLTIKIMPKSIWRDVSPQRFFSDIHHLQAIGSGPYKIKEKSFTNEEKIKSITLERNPYYHKREPFIDQIKFLFFENEYALLDSVNRGRVDGASLSSFVKTKSNFTVKKFQFPRYFAVFFNLESSEQLQNPEIRKALNYATNKNAIVEGALKTKTEEQIVNSPILPNIYGIDSPSLIYDFNKEKAEEILDKEGFELRENGFREKIIERENSFQFTTNMSIGSKGKEVEELQRCLSRFEEIYPEKEITGYYGNKTKNAVIAFQEKYKEEILEPQGLSEGTGDVKGGTHKKLNELCFRSTLEVTPLSFVLKTIEHSLLIETAEILKKQWKDLGIKIEIEIVPREERETELIRPRNYEMLLLGKVLGAIPDFFPFWHSSQKEDPGYNFSLYENSKADKILEEIRETLDVEEKKEKMSILQEIIIKDAPAIFLYSPKFIYLTKAKGIETEKIAEPSKRFSDIESWYLKTKREWI